MNVSQFAKPPRQTLSQSIASLEEELAQTKAHLNEAENEIIRLRQQLSTAQQDHHSRMAEAETSHRNRVTELETAFVKRIDTVTSERDAAKLHNAEVNARLRDCANRLLDIWNDDEKFHRFREALPSPVARDVNDHGN